MKYGHYTSNTLSSDETLQKVLNLYSLSHPYDRLTDRSEIQTL
jgi:hypothetical protein